MKKLLSAIFGAKKKPINNEVIWDSSSGESLESALLKAGDSISEAQKLSIMEIDRTHSANRYFDLTDKLRSDYRKSIKSKDYDQAWKITHELQGVHIELANNQGYTEEYFLAINSQVPEMQANILRIEKKHDQALACFLHFIAMHPMASDTRRKKLDAYYNRCRLKKTSLLDINEYLSLIMPDVDFGEIQAKVSHWREKEGENA